MKINILLDKKERGSTNFYKEISRIGVADALYVSTAIITKLSLVREVNFI